MYEKNVKVFSRNVDMQKSLTVFITVSVTRNHDIHVESEHSSLHLFHRTR